MTAKTGNQHEVLHHIYGIGDCCLCRSEAELATLRTENIRLTEAKDSAYQERDKLVAALSKLFPASLERHPQEEEWEDDWRWIVFIDLPTGQASWHIHDSELPMFEHLPRLAGRKWDGHTNEEKYRRLAALLSISGQ